MNQNQEYILFLTKWYPNHQDPQLGVFVQKHARLLSESYPVVVIYLCPFWNSSKPKVEFEQKGSLREYTVYYRPFKGFMKLFNPYMYYRFQKEVYSSLKQSPRHCFVNIGSKTGFLAYYHLRKQGIPYSLIEHWSGFVNGNFQKKNWIKKWFYKKLALKAKGIFAVSEFLKKGMEKELGLQEIKILPNLIESAKSEKIFPIENQILVIGDLEDEVKNISGILRAFNSFSEVHPDYKLILVGDGTSRSKLEKLSQELHLESKVHFLGRLDNKATLTEIQKCKFLISNSNFETFGMVQAEALLAGKPVLSTRSGGPEEFLDSSNSILIERGNDDALLQGLLQMHENYDRFDQQKISRSIHERFNRDKILNILVAEITSVSDSSK